VLASVSCSPATHELAQKQQSPDRFIVKDFLVNMFKIGKPAERLLHDRYASNHRATQLNLFANDFGDLIKKDTGKSAQEFIQSKLIEVAKERIFDPTKSVSEVAYELGFQYPQHFSRFFKQRVGVAPWEYRGLN
jgi:AraC-like DNA-binding protein